MLGSPARWISACLEDQVIEGEHEAAERDQSVVDQAMRLRFALADIGWIRKASESRKPDVHRARRQARQRRERRDDELVGRECEGRGHQLRPYELALT